MDKLSFIDDELARLASEGLLNPIREIGSAQGAWITVDGSRALNLCSNNYLGLADDRRLKDAAKKAIDEYGAGPAAVRSIAGSLTLHRELEEKLAAFKGAPAALSLQSGFMANIGVIPALAGEGDEIFSDELNHASIIDGCRLSKAKSTRYAHADPDDLATKLAASTANKKLVITDGVFSMDGDIAPLDKIVDAAEKHGAMVMVDDAHGEGVLGRGGRGIVEHFGLTGRVDVEVGTLSKAFGVVGGYIAGPQKLVTFLKQKARPFLFSSATTAADVAACIAAVEILGGSDELVKKLWDNARYFQDRMRGLGFDIGRTETPITPVMLGDAGLARRFSAELFQEGVFAQAIGFPTVPIRKARIRCMVSAAHTREDLEQAAGLFDRVRARVSA
ncbi:MAG: glycine C-acetyltransferase [Nitrospirae bacterium]|nr:glycine C-acetyltransferase [Nitrospirota bacterium]